MKRKFTGWHMATILVAFFGTVMTVNFVMARQAIGSFGGIVVENSYVASQEYNRWLEQAAEQEKLGWDAVTTWRPDGKLAVKLTGAPSHTALEATARHPLGRLPDRPLAFERLANGTYLSDESLADGRWILRLTAHDGVNEWREESELR